jgi:hypothetical protein
MLTEALCKSCQHQIDANGHHAPPCHLISLSLSNVASQWHPQLVRALSKGKGEVRPSLPILP